MGVLDASSVAVELRQEHGFVLLTLMLTIFVHYWYMTVGVSQARKKYGVKYPALYADASNKDAEQFNCIQRGHQNSLETLPHFLSVFAAAALKYPLLASVCGLVYNVGRVLYFQGYSTGKPAGRRRGAWSSICIIALYVPVFLFANSLLKLSK